MRCLLALVLLAGTAAAAPPCKRCTLDVPKSDEPVPMLVVLHGDREHASAAAARWRAAAKARNVALLSLECPKDQGCKDSFWKWDGEPSWVLEQVAAVTKSQSIDPKRIYLAGWSGGATYIGWHVQAWPEVFAAIVIHGGGAAPSDATCVELPAYFLVGDQNPLHHLVVALRDYYAACKQPFEWQLVKGGGHADEEAALTKRRALAILDWLSAHAR